MTIACEIGLSGRSRVAPHVAQRPLGLQSGQVAAQSTVVSGGAGAKRVGGSGTSGSKASGSVRLTRRGRLVVFAASLLVAGGGLLGYGASVLASSETPVGVTTIQVGSGDTLWSIAAKINPGGDIRRTIDDIVRLNAMENASGLQLGTALAVPNYG